MPRTKKQSRARPATQKHHHEPMPAEQAHTPSKVEEEVPSEDLQDIAEELEVQAKLVKEEPGEGLTDPETQLDLTIDAAFDQFIQAGEALQPSAKKI